ncbi:hypothetical protein AVEN_39754-1 [Araneus ventricosus]|uniref:Uncharacterized protein n=1 Tax=Araneus ventricosus TaxID=182803 RepID=A0A4Y2LLZ1_ARAVE|nr:hypothetical protein AVEN_39754-1 [Araneus ventricosus]
MRKGLNVLMQACCGIIQYLQAAVAYLLGVGLEAEGFLVSKQDSTEDPLHAKSCAGDPTSSCWCGAESWRGSASSGITLVI